MAEDEPEDQFTGFLCWYGVSGKALDDVNGGRASDGPSVPDRVGAGAAEIKVMSSAGFKAAYLGLVAEFERTTGHKIVNAWGPSMSNTPKPLPLSR